MGLMYIWEEDHGNFYIMKRYCLVLVLYCLCTAGYSQGLIDGDGSECGCGHDDPNPPSDHPHRPGPRASTTAGISADPNEIIGPTGFDDSIRWVSTNDILNYTILFENDPEFATANAQKVDVRFTFEDKAYIKGFGLGTFGFANYAWPIDNSPAAYQNRLDVRDSLVYETPMQIYVDLTAGVDIIKNQAFWTFNSIDPETGLNPWQVDRGMLPVNDSTHVGEGFVTFQLKPYEGLKTGDTISIAASIVFDQNDTIPTNRWRNTIDAGMPTSKVNGRVDSKNESLYHITMQASDDKGGSGLKNVHLYLANNFGIYEEYAVCPADTVIDFEAEKGKQYRFFSLAEDNVGNMEPIKMEADYIININAAPTDIALSDTIFQDDILPEGFIGELSSIDTEEDGIFSYDLAEGDGAIHNDMFLVKGTQLLAKDSFKSVEDSVFHVRLSTTDEGGLSFSKPFTLYMKNVLFRPKTDTITVVLCHDETFTHHGVTYDKTGVYHYSKSNEVMRDSTFLINLTILPEIAAPKVSIEGTQTLVSSYDRNNQWYREDGTPIEGETGQKFTPTEDGVYYVVSKNGDCYSDPSVRYKVLLSDKMDLQLNLAKGWNWISSNLSDANYRNAKDFIRPIQDKVECIMAYDSELVRESDNVFVGNLGDLNPTNGYMLLANEAIENVWSGTAVKPENTPLAIKQGWNWIGYVPVAENGLTISLDALSPAEGDVIKSLDKFAFFSGGKWTGTLESMAPGAGYMYYSNKASSFYYPSVRVFEVFSTNADDNVSSPWHIDENKYPYNMTLIGCVCSNGITASPGYFTIGAFVGNECRGIGHYVEDNLFLTIHGNINSSETITFKAFDNTTLKEYDIIENAVFDNTMIGTVQSPYRLNIDSDMRIVDAEVSRQYNIYPNPVRSTLYINGDINRIKSVAILTHNGVLVAQTDNYTADGMDVSYLVEGAYVAVINTEDGIVARKILKAY